MATSNELNVKKSTIIGAAALPAGVGIVMGMKLSRVLGLGLTGLGAGCLVTVLATVGSRFAERRIEVREKERLGR